MRAAYAAEHNVFANGGFEKWPSGAQAPVYYSSPAPGTSTHILRENDVVAQGEVAVKQVWVGRNNAPPPARFNTALFDIAPNTQYDLVVSANNPSDVPLQVSLWQVSVEEGIEQYASLVWGTITIPPNIPAYSDYAGRFTTLSSDRGSVLLITTECLGGGDAPVTAFWDNWRLAIVPK